MNSGSAVGSAINCDMGRSRSPARALEPHVRKHSRRDLNLRSPGRESGAVAAETLRRMKNTCQRPASCGTDACRSFCMEVVLMEPLFLLVGALLVAFPPLLGWFLVLLVFRIIWSIGHRY